MEVTGHVVELLTRAGCTACDRALVELEGVCGPVGLAVRTRDVDEAAAAGEPELRAEYGDRLPVVLLDGREHSYLDVDVARLRSDLGLPR